MGKTKIEWTDRTWNPVTGCTKTSPGCANCYAEIMANRLRAIGLKKYENGFSVTTHEESLREPLEWTGKQNIFVCSMGDLFHRNVPFEFIDRVMETIKKTPQHRYQILTKRAERMKEYFSTREVPKNAWIGVTVESSEMKQRAERLKEIKATVRFLSCEPLLNDIGDIDLTGIDWVIAGGESGQRARRMEKEWLLSLKTQTEKQDTPFFFKQWGTWGEDGEKRDKKRNGNTIEGKAYRQMPKEKPI